MKVNSSYLIIWEQLGYYKRILENKIILCNGDTLPLTYSPPPEGTEKLPQVSWVIPSILLSEHAPTSIKKGMIWVTDVVNAIMNSTYWNNTAIIISWDDYGRFYDHVAPPKEDKFGLSFRVPALIVSPYSKPGYIDHTLYSFESILKFIEWRFGLPSLTYRDAHANNLLNAFDFSQYPNPPHVIPLSKQELESIAPFINIGMGD